MLVTAAAAVTGCSGFQSPKVTVSQPVVTERSDEAVVLSFDTGLQNPNSVPLELREMNYVLRVNGAKVYEGRRDAQATLPAEGGSTLMIPAVIPYSVTGWPPGSMPAEVRYELSGRLLYITPGQIREILNDSGIYRPTVGFHAAGVLQPQ